MNIDKETNDKVNIILDECFSKKLFIEGERRLSKLFMSDYFKLKSMCIKYNLLYRLIFAKYMNSKENNKDSIIYLVKQLKKDMDETEGYKESYTNDYCNMLSVYCDFEIGLTKEEKLECYNFSYYYYKELYEFNKKNIDAYIRMVNIKFNIEKLNQNFNEVLNIFKNLHNLKNEKAIVTTDQMLNDIKEIGGILYESALKII